MLDLDAKNVKIFKEDAQNFQKRHFWGKKQVSGREFLFLSIAYTMREKLLEESLESNSVSESFDFRSFVIEVYMNRNGEKEVLALHDNGRTCPNLESLIRSGLPVWSDVEREAKEDRVRERETMDHLRRVCH